jgi:anthranilate synthase/aminodeoxychorismate synthase-like glutamine amidotransferase
MKILLIDNNDSFTMNLAQILEELNAEVKIIKYEKFKIIDVEKYNGIVISPGPGLVWEYDKIFSMLKKYETNKKILGICLGHQIIGVNYGAKLYQLEKIEHGKKSKNYIIKKHDIFKNLPYEIDIGRYHSWGISEKDFPSDLEVISKSEDNVIMGLKHKKYNIIGLQFHPESIITERGSEIIYNWLKL